MYCSDLLTINTLGKVNMQLPPVYQTSMLESFYSLIIQFPPPVPDFFSLGTNSRYSNLCTGFVLGLHVYDHFIITQCHLPRYKTGVVGIS